MSISLHFLTALPDRAVIAITGPDAKSFLQRVITHGPEGVKTGQAQFSALLTPQGKILAEFFIFDDGDGGLLLDVPASQADSLVKRFALYRLRADAQITLQDELSVAVALGEGEQELQTIAQAIAPDPRCKGLGLRAIVPAGGPDSEFDAYNTARVSCGVPEFGADYGPAEVFSTDVNHDVLNAIDYKKGCFVGQEVASRMHRKGGVRKRTLGLTAPGGVKPGDEIFAEERVLGTVTSIYGHHGLALMRIDRVAKALADGHSLSLKNSEMTLNDPFGFLKSDESDG